MEKPDRSKFPNQGAYDQAYDRWSENQQGAMPTKPGPISDQQKEVALRWQTALEEIGAMVGMKVGGNLSTDVAPLVRAAIDRQSGPAPALIIPMNELLTDEQVENLSAIFDAYEHGISHGFKEDGKKDGPYSLHTCRTAHLVGYDVGLERAALVKDAKAHTTPPAPKLTECRHCGFMVALNQAPAPNSGPGNLAAPGAGQDDAVRDADRYRYLRRADNGICIMVPAPPDDAWVPHTDQLDAAIDAAIKAEKDGAA